MEDKIIATNKQAHRDYVILEAVEAGIELKGSEVKSLREARTNLKDSFGRIENSEVFLYNLHISPYEKGSYFNVEPTRTRRLLLHKNQIKRLAAAVAQKGLTLIPLKLYFKESFAKVELALVKGKKFYDKRQDIKKREQDLEIRRALRKK